MSIDCIKEKNSALTAQERYDIIDFAIKSAQEDDGFINTFILQRALCLYALILLTEEPRKSELQDMVSNDLLGSWNELIQSKEIENFAQDYSNTLDLLAEEAEQWCDDYIAHYQSVGNIVSIIETLSTNLLGKAQETFSSFQNDETIQQVMRIAEDWGMNNGSITEEDKQSLFQVIE